MFRICEADACYIQGGAILNCAFESYSDEPARMLDTYLATDLILREGRSNQRFTMNSGQECTHFVLRPPGGTSTCISQPESS